jgi:hypothetical protein
MPIIKPGLKAGNKVLPASCRQIKHCPRAVPWQSAFAPSGPQILLLIIQFDPPAG